MHGEAWSIGQLWVSLIRNEAGRYVKAHIKESLAVHRSVERFPSWVITHIESGLRFPSVYHTAEEAKNKAEQLLCIEGLWGNPLEAFSKGLREVDCKRVNAILGDEYCKPGKVGDHIKLALERRKTQPVAL